MRGKLPALTVVSDIDLLARSNNGALRDGVEARLERKAIVSQRHYGTASDKELLQMKIRAISRRLKTLC